MGGSGRLVHWTATVLPWLIIKLADLHYRLEWRREEREHKKGGEWGGGNRLSSGWSRLAVRENGWKTLAIRTLQSFDSSCSGAPEFTSHYSGLVVEASWSIMFRVISYLSEQSWRPLRNLSCSRRPLPCAQPLPEVWIGCIVVSFFLCIQFSWCKAGPCVTQTLSRWDRLNYIF